jgi:Kinase associated domain 1
MRYHTGPIDQRVLSSRDPTTLVTLIKKTCYKLDLEIISSSTDPYKFKVLRNGIIKGNFVSAILDKISIFGRDRGYDGTEIAKNELPLPDQESIKVYISVRRIKNLKGLYTVDVKRVRGDVWQFKRVYEDFVEALELNG